ncbi:hypothetical protein Q31b_30660 [Novipirellula aureliae]|uniref:Uncharacterized protein n=1 Tax=Novipirellula aureliae TaxID=2527966 RepID=A0A5C6DYU9_9BACT|nr:hypothetical protein [Novipirellula aureliae]TWU41615.1 hypothetical protein Q31b_30660 [Novipirellula aureliae]
MVRLARSEVFDPQEVVIAHLYNRTCRRCFLMGNDQVSGKGGQLGTEHDSGGFAFSLTEVYDSW